MAVNRHSALRKCRNAVSAGVLSPISSAVGRNGAVGDKRNARAGARNYPCAAAADAVRVGAGALIVFGDYQIAPKPPSGRLWLVAADAAVVLGGHCLRAGDGAFRAPARVTFFFCKKKVTKENHLDLRSKDPLARGGQVQIWRCWLRGIGAAWDVVGSGDCLYLVRRCR